MKNVMIALLGFVIILGASCSKKVVVTKQPVKKTAKVAVLQPFTQGYTRDLAPKDSASYILDTWVYNSITIKLEINIFDKFKPFYVDENGVTHKANTDVEITKSVPKLTPGRIIGWHFVKARNGWTVIDSVTVKFDANDRTYYSHLFRTKESQIFRLDPNAEIVYKNKTYKVLVTPPESGEVCILEFYGDEKTNSIKINEIARGFNSSAVPTNDYPPIKTEQKKDDPSSIKTGQKDDDDYK